MVSPETIDRLGTLAGLDPCAATRMMTTHAASGSRKHSPHDRTPGEGSDPT